jgi:protein-disulfide isomerase-like protein with CxxC motif
MKAVALLLIASIGTASADEASRQAQYEASVQKSKEAAEANINRSNLQGLPINLIIQAGSLAYASRNAIENGQPASVIQATLPMLMQGTTVSAILNGRK